MIFQMHVHRHTHIVTHMHNYINILHMHVHRHTHPCSHISVQYTNILHTKHTQKGRVARRGNMNHVTKANMLWNIAFLKHLQSLTYVHRSVCELSSGCLCTMTQRWTVPGCPYTLTQGWAVPGCPYTLTQGWIVPGCPCTLTQGWTVPGCQCTLTQGGVERVVHRACISAFES